MAVGKDFSINSEISLGISPRSGNIAPAMGLTKRKGHLIYLTGAEHAALTKLAATHQTTVPTGPTAGKPSFRILLQHIAAGKLKVA